MAGRPPDSLHPQCEDAFGGTGCAGRRQHRRFGWTNPLLVGADGVIIAGHARLLAARKLGMTEVPVIVLDHLSETQRRALVIADNRLAMNAGWDEEMLRVELESLQVDGFNLDIVGFSDEEIEALLQEPEEARAGNTDDDAVRRRRRRRSRSPAMCGFWGSTACSAATARRWNPWRRCLPAAWRYCLHRSAVQRELRRDDEGQAPQEESQDRQRQSGDGFEQFCGTPARTCWR